MKTEHKILGAINFALIIGFGTRFLMRLNYEFVIYVCAIIFVLTLIALSIKKIHYTLAALVGMTVWSAMHLAGGGINVGEGRLYDVILIPLSLEYPIFRYDQLVHIWGFGATTLIMYCLVKDLLIRPDRASIRLGVVLVMAGLGAGALNEIIEFFVNEFVPESGVGGYVNTSLDLCSDLIGTILAMIYIRLRYQNISGTDRVA